MNITPKEKRQLVMLNRLELAETRGNTSEVIVDFLYESEEEMHQSIENIENDVKKSLGDFKEYVNDLESSLEENIDDFADKLENIMSELKSGELKGDTGRDGLNGQNGKDGINGDDGKEGRDGRDGIPGKNGRDGIDGRDGQDVDPIEVKKLDKRITDVERISAYNAASVPVTTMFVLKNGAPVGRAKNINFVESASVSVNITQTGDQMNVTLTSSSSGSGLTEIKATGLVNGNNQAFTFPTKPTYIVSDHAWYKENVGWTWNSGTLTATMTIPPNDDIWGF